tara:strand:- start:6571 stop:8253 length:1683 start_codon:yes stop_codon:yes gene_type:complete
MEILNRVSKTSDEKEFYSPMPRNYEKGKTKYIIVTGSVMSGVGKGILTASLANLLKCHGFKVSPVKFDGYLNCDAGTLNPYRHGEVFVLDDGTECDLDLGTYERSLMQKLSKDNYLTAGKIFKNIIDKERAGKFLGRDVQFIPHVTGEIKLFLRKLALYSDSDIVLVEVGGTAGDLENSYFLEAMRELKYEEGNNNVCFINVTYILEPRSLGEQKSKAAQLGLRNLMNLGIQPDIVACRAHNEVDQKVMEKISIFANVPLNNVISMKDVDSIYKIPNHLKEKRIDEAIFKILKVQPKQNEHQELTFSSWENFVNKETNKEITIGIIGKYTNIHDSYLSIIKTLEHVSSLLETKINIKWIESTEIETPEEVLKDVQGIIVPGGFGKRGVEGKIKCINYARTNNLPYLGLCLGFQMALIEYARNVLNLKDANSREIEPETPHPVIDILPEQKNINSLGGNMRLGGHDVEIKENTMAQEIYNSNFIRERFRHRWECNPDYIKQFENSGLIFSGKAPRREIMQILELPDHPFFIGTQFHPEFTSNPLKPHPLYVKFIEACIANR